MSPQVIDINSKMPFNFNKSKIFIGIIIIVLLFIVLSALNPIVIIQAGHRGITSRLGAVQEAVRDEGLSFRIPVVDKVITVDVRTKKVDLREPGRLSAVSKDLQDVYVDAVVTYHPSPNSIAKIYQEIGLDYEEKKVIPITINSIKTHTAKYNVTEILQNREKITKDVNNDLKEQLSRYNIFLEDVSLTNIDFRPEYKQAIEQKQIAEKEVETQKFKLDKQALEAQQVVKQAEAQKQAKILEGEGIKQYNESIKQELTQEILKFKEIENQEKAISKWNGQYPATVVGGNSVPLIQIQNNKEETKR